MKYYDSGDGHLYCHDQEETAIHVNTNNPLINRVAMEDVPHWAQSETTKEKFDDALTNIFLEIGIHKHLTNETKRT